MYLYCCSRLLGRDYQESAEQSDPLRLLCQTVTHRIPAKWYLNQSQLGNRAEMSPEAAGIAACLMTYSHHACRTECYAMTVHYYRLRDYALQHPECSAIMRIID